MKTEFKKWLCELINEEHNFVISFTKDEWLVALIKAMWAINRERKYNIKMDYNKLVVYNCDKTEIDNKKYFHYDNYNNSEQTALEKALECIFEKETK